MESPESLHILLWISIISGATIFRRRYQLPVLRDYVQTMRGVPGEPSENVRYTKTKLKSEFFFFFFAHRLNFLGIQTEKGSIFLPVDRTPATRGSWGMSVGMDWTSHALHFGGDSERVGREKLAIIRTIITMAVWGREDREAVIFEIIAKQWSKRERIKMNKPNG